MIFLSRLACLNLYVLLLFGYIHLALDQLSSHHYFDLQRNVKDISISI
jgi:hypothetical protein